MVLRRDEQRLEQRAATVNPGAWAPGMDAPAHRTGDREPPRDGQRLSEGGGAGGPRPRAAGDTGGKTGHFRGGVHRLGRSTPGHHGGGIDRRRSTGPGADGQRLRAVPRAHRGRPDPGAQRRRHLPGPGQRPRFSGQLCECPPLRAAPAWASIRRGARGHHDGPRRGGPG